MPHLYAVLAEVKFEVASAGCARACHLFNCDAVRTLLDAH